MVWEKMRTRCPCSCHRGRILARTFSFPERFTNENSLFSSSSSSTFFSSLPSPAAAPFWPSSSSSSSTSSPSPPIQLPFLPPPLEMRSLVPYLTKCRICDEQSE